MPPRSGGGAAVPLLIPRNGKVLRIGIVGTGDVSAWHARAIHAQPDMELVAAADLERLKCEEWAADFNKGRGCAAYGSLDEMATREQLDGVVVAVPDAFHATVATRAMRVYGLPTLGEKPPGTEVAHADEIALASEETGVPFLLGLVYVHGIPTAEPFSTEERLGHRYFAVADWLRRRGLVTWRKGPHDPFPDLGVHLIGVLGHLFGWPVPTWVSARSFGYTGTEALVNVLFTEGAVPLDPTAFEGVDTTLATFDFHRPEMRWNVHTAFLGNFSTSEAIRTQLFGARAGLEIPFVAGIRDPRQYTPVEYREEAGVLGTTQWNYPAPPTMARSFERQMAHFGQVIRRRTRPVAGPAEARIVQRMIAAVHLSAAEQGRQIEYSSI
jgi:predicted dehydrogenase